jgi:hypothetical protein
MPGPPVGDGLRLIGPEGLMRKETRRHFSNVIGFLRLFLRRFNKD